MGSQISNQCLLAICHEVCGVVMQCYAFLILFAPVAATLANFTLWPLRK